MTKLSGTGICSCLVKLGDTVGLTDTLKTADIETSPTIVRMKQGINEIPSENPGVSTPQSPSPLNNLAFSFDDIACISGDNFRQILLNNDKFHGVDPVTTPYKAWIDSLPQHLSKTGQHIVASWWSFELLSDVYNCGAAHTKLFGPEVDHTRKEHCIHAAYVSRQLSERALINLTDHEKIVLELVMLLHDPHRLGSHALDRVIGSIPGAPPIDKWGWSHDFHEYHGAQEVYRDRELKEILGEYWPDVLAVLSYPDKRDPKDPTRIKDFGHAPPILPEDHRPPLTKDRIYLIHRLKDEVDRMSYLELDFRRSGFDPFLTRGLLACIEHYQEHLVTVGSNLATLLPDKRRLPQLEGPFDPWIAARQLHREHVATHPTACLVDAVLQEALTQPSETRFKGRMDTEGYYRYVRNIALEGSYHKLFGTSVLEVLLAPRSHHSTLGLEDLYAPLVTLTRDDLRDGTGINPLNELVDTNKSQQVSGTPRADMTRLEHDLRCFLQKRGLDSKIFMVLSNDFEKDFAFKCVEQPTDVGRKEFLTGLRDGDDIGLGTMFDVVRFGTRSSPKAEKLIVAIRALDESGACRNLQPIQTAIKDFFRQSKLLKDPATLEASYNHRAFCDPLKPQVFRPEVQERMANFEPAWVTRGGCGLKLTNGES